MSTISGDLWLYNPIFNPRARVSIVVDLVEITPLTRDPIEIPLVDMSMNPITSMMEAFQEIENRPIQASAKVAVGEWMIVGSVVTEAAVSSQNNLDEANQILDSGLNQIEEFRDIIGDNDYSKQLDLFERFSGDLVGGTSKGIAEANFFNTLVLCFEAKPIIVPESNADTIALLGLLAVAGGPGGVRRARLSLQPALPCNYTNEKSAVAAVFSIPPCERSAVGSHDGLRHLLSEYLKKSANLW